METDFTDANELSSWQPLQEVHIENHLKWFEDHKKCLDGVKQKADRVKQAMESSSGDEYLERLSDLEGTVTKLSNYIKDSESNPEIEIPDI